ncbi:MAG: hypothetical protein H0T60_19140 [Acidobacteria bacterium]|nr:hypothetical protein [Acidobacteriota bacterium]
MIEEVSEKEVTYLKELKKYQRKWVAVHEAEDGDIIVGSGEDAVEAKRDAQEKGFNDVVLFWVRPSNAGFITLSNVGA